MTKRLAIALVAFAFLAPLARAADEFAVDAVHSSVVFRVKHMNVSYAYGRFNKMKGKFLLDESKPDACTIQMEIDVGSIDTANAARDAHLKGADFFDVKAHPTATFKSTKIAAKGKDEFEVTGDMTIKDKKQTITFTATKTGEGAAPPQMGGGKMAGMECQVTIKRSDYGVGNMPANMLGEDVKLFISLEGSHK